MIVDLPRRKRPHKTSEMLEMIDSALKQNDELTSQKLGSQLKEQFPLLNVPLSTIKCARKENR